MGTPGTFGNNSGLRQIPGGAKSIPQSFLNHIGREIDKARQSPNVGQIHTQTPGGSNIDIASTVEQYVAGSYRPLPFEVGLLKVNSGGSLQVTIAEGRIFGRVDWDWAKFDGISIGASGYNHTYSGPFSDAGSTKPEPVPNPADQSSSTPTGNGTTNTPPKPSVPTSNLPNGGKGSAYSNAKSGNAASITGNTSGTFHTVQKSGNAGTIITGKTRSTNGVYHTPMPTYQP